MIRLFTGLSIPVDISARLHLLSGGIPGAKWNTPENYHITLAFIGDVDEDAAERAHAALSQVRANGFSLHLKGCGLFERGTQPHTLFAGVEASERLLALKNKTDHALEKEGVPFERRKYTPHVTLARLKNPDTRKLAAFIASNSLLTTTPFTVEDFVLYRSHMSEAGNFYEAVARYPLECADVT